MKISEPLFISENICLGPIDHEHDAAIESRWTHDASYMRLVHIDPAMPLSAAQVKKRYESIEKKQEEDHDLYYFTIRMRTDDRLIGFAKVDWIQWSNGLGNILLGIGEPEARRKGYGSEALRLMLRFAFDELNLFRLSALIPEYNPAGLKLARKFGFVEEVCRRQALERDGRRWDTIHFGLLREEWLANLSFVQSHPHGG